MSLPGETNVGEFTALSARCERRRNALSEVLSMFETDWVREHLMGTSPSTDAAILSSPLQQLHSLAFLSDVSFDPLDRARTDCTAVMSCESVMVPAYSKDGIGAGYCVSETFGLSSENFIASHNGSSTQHFVVREENGTYLSLLRQYHVELVMFVTAKQRTMSFFIFAFPKSSFTSLVTAKVREVAAFERLLCATVFSQSTRHCLICGATACQACTCSYRFVSSKNPLDLSSIRHNIIQTHLGHCVGKGMYEIFSNGQPKTVIPVDAQNKVIRDARHGAAQRLVKWAVVDALKKAPIGVARALTSPFAPNDPPQILDGNDCQPSYTEPVLHMDCLGTTRATSQPSPETKCMADVLSFPDLSVPSAVPSIQPSNCTGGNSHNVDPFWPWNDYASSHAPIQDTNLIPVSIPSYPTERLSSDQPPRAILPEHVVATTKPVAPSQNGSNQLSIERAIRIAPRNMANTEHSQPNVSVLDAEKMTKAVEELRAWRLYQRKIRNRESAARSNRARKQRLKLAKTKK